MLNFVKKREGTLVSFDEIKIRQAIRMARLATWIKEPIEDQLTSDAVRIIDKKFRDVIPSVEDIQNMIELVLIKNKYPEVAKAYTLYRERHEDIRGTKKVIEQDLRFSINALHVLQRRYLKRDNKGNIVETPTGMFERAAKAVAKAEASHNKKQQKMIEIEFYKMMNNLEFLPNSPLLMNAETKNQQFAACYVLGIEDSLDSIFSTLKTTAMIHQTSGGTGFSFSKLRPKGDIIESTKGRSSGPLSFMKIYDAATDVMKSGGRKRGANMAVLRIDHPDIIKFITAKENQKEFQNFNLSVAITDKFMSAVAENKPYMLIDPHTKKEVMEINSHDVFNLLCYMAWKTGDPGILFIDEINRHNPTPELGEIEATNVCGEQILLNNEACILGSINLTKIVENKEIDYNHLKKIVHCAVRFLDNSIDVCEFPTKEIKETVLKNRKIGLGIMGFSQMLCLLGASYDSEGALKIAEEVMSFINKESKNASIKLAKERGSFPEFKKSALRKRYKMMRNATTTTIAPTGSISLIAGVSSGIEPIFAPAYIRDVYGTKKMVEVDPIFESILKKEEIYNKDLILEISKLGSLKDVTRIPQKIKELFKTSHEISPMQHVKMQAAFQKHTDNAVSKTVNLAPDSTVKDVQDIFLLAYKLKCKGITVYRYKSKDIQIFYTPDKKYVKAEAEYSGGCPLAECSH